MKLPNFNTIAMGFLFTVFVALGLNFLTELVFHIEQPAQKGYAIEVAEASTGAAPVEEVKEDILPLLASADLGKGEKLIKRCTACHAFEKGGANKVGPALYGVVGKAIAAADGFGYSGALTDYASGKTWTFEELDGFLKKPSKWVKGTAMGFAGLKKLDDRANIIAYMNSLSDSPLELPAQ